MLPMHGFACSSDSILVLAREMHDSVRVPARVKMLPWAVRTLAESTLDGSDVVPPLEAVGLGSTAGAVNSGAVGAVGVGRVMVGRSLSPAFTRTKAPTPATDRTTSAPIMSSATSAPPPLRCGGGGGKPPGIGGPCMGGPYMGGPGIGGPGSGAPTGALGGAGGGAAGTAGGGNPGWPGS